MDLSKTLQTNDIIICLLPAIGYNEAVSVLTSNFSGKPVCYVTLNKTSSAVAEMCARHNVDTKNFVFVDGVTPLISEENVHKHHFHVDSITSLVTLSSNIEQSIGGTSDCVVFDSLVNLCGSHSRIEVREFFIHLSGILRKKKYKGIFYITGKREEDQLIGGINNLSLLVDDLSSYTDLIIDVVPEE